MAAEFTSLETPSSITGFGVGIELNLAFHEDLLVEVLEQRKLTRNHIVKDIPHETRGNIGLKHHERPPLYIHTRPHHRGWVLKIDEEEADTSRDWRTDGYDGEEQAGVVGEYWTYWPLLIVQQLLRRLKNYAIDVEVSTRRNFPHASAYKECKVANDHSLVPTGKLEMGFALGDRIADEALTDWDNADVELVTPIMHRRGNDI